MSHLRFELRLPQPQREVLTTIQVQHMRIVHFESYLKLTVGTSASLHSWKGLNSRRGAHGHAERGEQQLIH